MSSGLIFDVQRTSLYDGPGIRTAVFFKGCPLRCLWCHNPESQSRRVEISYRPEACTACGVCETACGQGAQQIVDGKHVYQRDKCQRCGKCAAACLYEALKLAGEETTVERVMEVVRRDVPYYRQSGGGLTLTGGEPMLQVNFAGELLRAARAEGIHTCLETCGLAGREAYEAIQPLVDLFLWDFKAADAILHRSLTGVSNEIILSNLDYLYRKGARIRLRCPLVPGVNDDTAQLAGIAALAATYPQLEAVELLPYHNIGNSKYGRYDIPNPLPGLASSSESDKQRWVEDLRGLGCGKVILS